MRKNKPPLTKEDLIQKIEARLQEPDVPLREFTSLTKRLANLRGWSSKADTFGYRRLKPRSRSRCQIGGAILGHESSLRSALAASAVVGFDGIGNSISSKPTGPSKRAFLLINSATSYGARMRKHAVRRCDPQFRRGSYQQRGNAYCSKSLKF